MSEHFFAISDSGGKLEIVSLGSGLTAAIDPSVTHAQPFAGADHFRSVSGQSVRQTRPGVFKVIGSDVEYERIVDEHG